MIRTFILALALMLVSSGFTPKARAADEPQEIKPHSALVHSIAVSPDGKTVATGGFDKTIILWDLEGSKLKELRKLAGHTDPIYCVTFDPEGKKIASASQDKTIRIWNVADGKQLNELKGHTDLVGCIEYSPDGKLLASGGGSQDKTVRLWDTKENKEIKNLGAHTGSVYALAFSPDGKLLASSGAEGIIKIWDVAAKKELKQIKAHELGVTGLSFTDVPDELISVSQDRTMRVWNIRSFRIWGMGRELTKQFGPTPDDLYGLARNKQTKSIATIGYSGRISVWDMNDPKPKFTRQIKSPGYCIAYLRDGKGVLTGHDNGSVVLTPITSN